MWDAEPGISGYSRCPEEGNFGGYEGVPERPLASPQRPVECSRRCRRLWWVLSSAGHSRGVCRPEASCIWPRRRTTTPGSTTALHVPCKQPRVQHSGRGRSLSGVECASAVHDQGRKVPPVKPGRPGSTVPRWSQQRPALLHQVL